MSGDIIWRMSKKASEIIDPTEQFQLIERASQVATGVGSATAVVSGAVGMGTETHEIIWMAGVISGIITGISGVLVNWYYKHKESKFHENRRKNIKSSH